jgi:hypothetical protein
MIQTHPTANLVLRALALILTVAGVMIGLAAGWAQVLPAIVIGLALLVVDEDTRRRRDGGTART